MARLMRARCPRTRLHAASRAIFGLHALGRIQRIGRIIGDGVSGFGLESRTAASELTSHLLRPGMPGNSWRGPTRSVPLKAAWSRETHGSLRCTVWDDVSGHSVNCRFDDSLFDEVVEALRMRTKVLVTGRVRRDVDGRPREVTDITDLRPLGSASRRRSVLALEGVYTAMEGNSLDYLAEIRGE